MRCVDVTGRIARYVEGRQEEGAANGTINRELAALKRGFTLCFRAGKVAQIPYIPMLKEAQPRQGFFTDPDIRALLAELPEDLRPLIECAYLTGWRIDDELLPLKWSHVDFSAGTLRLDTSKNGEARVYPFSVRPRLETLLRQQRELTSSLEREQGRIIPHVFHRCGEPIKDFRWTWDAACVKIGLPGRVRHDLRRSAIRNMEHAGVPRSVAMKLVGHKTESVYTRYAVMFEDDLKRGVEKLALLDESHVAQVGDRSGRVVPLVKPEATSGKSEKGGDTVGIGVAVSRQQSGGGSK
jgi:integrase